MDNGSTDGTAYAVRAQFPGVTLLTLRRNHGAPGRNVGTWVCKPAAPPTSPSATTTGIMLRSIPRDWASVVAVAEALAGLPWVLRERQVVPPEVEHGLRLLEAPQRHSRARRYVG